MKFHIYFVIGRRSHDLSKVLLVTDACTLSPPSRPGEPPLPHSLSPPGLPGEPSLPHGPPVISVQSVPSQVSAAQPAVVPQPAAHRASTPHDSRRAGLFGPRPLPSNVRRRATDDLKEHFSANSTVGGSYEESVSADENEYSSVHASVGGSYNEPIGAGDMQKAEC